MRYPEVFLVPVLMLFDYYLTLLGAYLAEQSYRRHFKVEHYELNPIWQKAVAQRRWLNWRHLALVFLVTVLLVLSLEVLELDAALYYALLGFLFTFYGLVLGRHLSNILTFAHLRRHPDGVTGEVRFSHRYVLLLSINQQLVAAVPIVFIAIFAPSPFVFGAVAGILAMLLIKAFWLARTPRDSREHSQIGSSA
jgi:hypothetical protein